MDWKNDEKRREYWRKYQYQRYHTDPEYREQHLAKCRETYAKGRAEFISETPDHVDVILDIHDNRLIDDPERLSYEFLQQIVRKKKVRS